MSLRSCFRCNTPFSEFVVENTCPNCGYVSKDRDTASTFNTFAEYESNFQLGPLDSNLTADIQLPSTILVQPKFTRFVPLTRDVPNHTDFELIGSGGMGLVYRAIQRPVDRLVAVKVMNQFNSDQLMLDRFVNEVKAHARINHPFIVPIYEVGQCSQGPYFTIGVPPWGHTR